MSEKSEATKLEEMKRTLADGFLAAVRLRAKVIDKLSIDPVDVYFASLKILLIAGVPKRYAKMPPGYYTQRLTDAIKKPNSATPRLSKQMELFANPHVGLWTKDPNALVRGWLAIVHAIDEDDHDAQEKTESLNRLVDSPFLNAKESAAYLRLSTVKALYSMVERTCGGNRERRKYKFKKEQLDALQKGIDPWRTKS